MVSNLIERIEEGKNFITKTINKEKIDIGIILGTGLGGLSKKIEKAKKVRYEDIPGFVIPTGLTHAGELIYGKIHNKDVIAFSGRFHYYEGYSLDIITFPVRVTKALGAKLLIVSNAAGGLNREFTEGDIMIITDHINFMGVNPLIGKNEDKLGPRFPDMYNAYDKDLIKLAEEVALSLKIRVKKGVYVAVTGPNLETPAEYRFFSHFADAIGMSTVPEVIVARHSNLKVLGFSIITDMCSEDRIGPVNIDKIINIANKSEPKLSLLVTQIIKNLKKN